MKTLRASLPIAAITLSLGIASPASAQDLDSSPTITEESYVDYLSSQNTPGSDEALTAFLETDEETQDHYIQNLNDPEFINAIFSQDPAAMEEHGLQMDYTVNSGAPMEGMAQAAASGSQSNTYAYSMSWGPIPTINFSQTYAFTTNGSEVTSSDNCTATFSKFVPMGTITESTQHRDIGSNGYCRTDWTATFLNNGTLTLSSVQEQEVNGAGGVVSQNFYDI